MTMWQYDPETGVLIGPVANATDIEPPVVPEGQQAVFVDGAWTLQAIPAPLPEDDAVGEEAYEAENVAIDDEANAP